MGRKYRREYYKKFYTKLWLRKSVATKVRDLCDELDLPLSDCIDHVIGVYSSVTGTVVS